MFPKVYAIVLNYNGFEDSKDCIKSLLGSISKIEIIVVDNNSMDGSYKKLQTLFTGIHYIKSDENLGYAGGMNIGIKYALSNNADYVILINQDIVVTTNFLQPLIEKFQEDESIGIVSPKVLYKNNNDMIYCAGGKISNLLCTGVAEFQGKKSTEYANEDREISLAEGCFLIIKREVFEKVGLLNEKYFMYLEDVEFSQRVRKYFKLVFAHDSIIFHKSGAGTGWSHFTPLYNYYYTRNRLWVYQDRTFDQKLYVFLISVIIFLVKSFRIILSARQRKLIALSALWSGLVDGVRLMMGIQLKTSNSIKY